jgi:hypothetical protein
MPLIIILIFRAVFALRAIREIVLISASKRVNVTKFLNVVKTKNIPNADRIAVIVVEISEGILTAL